MLKFILFLFIPVFIQASMIDLNRYEGKIFSQNGEDGVTLKIFQKIGTTDKTYVEFGVQEGYECNTSMLREYFGWTGLMMDGEYENERINLKTEWITAENINQLFEKYKVPEEFDLLSIDIDYNDFHVWYAINEKYRPRVVIIEYNAAIPPSDDKVAVYGPNLCWDGTNYYGAGILPMKILGNKKGYTLVHADANGVNLFFIRSDILKEMNLSFKNQDDEIKLYRAPNFFGKGISHLQDPFNRQYISSEEAMKIAH